MQNKYPDYIPDLLFFKMAASYTVPIPTILLHASLSIDEVKQVNFVFQLSYIKIRLINKQVYITDVV